MKTISFHIHGWERIFKIGYRYFFLTLLIAAFVFVLVGSRGFDSRAQLLVMTNIVVTLVSPTSGQTLCCTINLAVDATGLVQRVEFWSIQGTNAQILFTDFDAPYAYSWDTIAGNVPNGTYTFAAKAYDGFGTFVPSNLSTIEILNNIVTVPPPSLDTIPPTVVFTQPISGQTLSGITILKADASDNVGINEVKFFTEGGILLGGDTTAPYEYGWDTSAVSDGTYSLYARAYDMSNNATTSVFVQVGIFNQSATTPSDTTPPTVSFIYPASGATLSGSVILEASATDNAGILEVKFYRDAINSPAAIGSDTTSPYTTVWDTTSVTNGTYTLKVVAFDARNNFSHQAITVTVSNQQQTSPPPSSSDTTAPFLSEIQTANITTSDSTIGWITDELSTSQVEYGIFTNYGFITILDTFLTTHHVQALTGLTQGTTYHFRIISKDASGNIARSLDREFTTSIGEATVSGNIRDEQNTILTNLSGWVFAKQLNVLNPLFFGGPIEQGAFSFSVLPGTYEAGIELPPNSVYVPGSRREVTIAAGEQRTFTLSVQSAKATITGKLKDSSGSVVTGVAATVFVTGANGAWVDAEVNIQTGAFTMSLASGTWYMGAHVSSSFGYFAKPILDSQISLLSGQTIVKDVFVIQNESVVSGKVLDPIGKSLAGIWVSVDQESGTESPLTLTGSPTVSVVTGSTDGSGAFRFTVPPGKYVVYAHLPSSLGLMNPVGVSVEIGIGQEQSVTLAGRPSNVRISGKVLLEGAGTSAFVFAWSEKGGVAETRASSDGSYFFSIVGGDTWHLGATKAIERNIYKSQEIVATIGNEATLSRDPTLIKTLDTLPDPVSKSATTSNIQSVSLADGASVIIPDGAINVAGSATITVTPTSELPSQATALPIGIGYNIEARDAGGNNITSFTKDISIRLPYRKEKLDVLGVSEDDLIASFWDEANRTWKKVDTFAVDKTNSVVAITINHLTRFALIAPAAAASSPGAIFPGGMPLERQVTSAVDLREGDLIRGPDGIKVYIINDKGYKRHIFNPAIFNMYGHLKWGNIKEVSQVTLDLYAVSDLYRADSDPKVYSLEEIDEVRGVAIKHWLDMTPAKFGAEGYVWGQVFVVNEKERDYYQTGNPIIR